MNTGSMCAAGPWLACVVGVVAGAAAPPSAQASERPEPRFRLDVGGAFSRFEQQVKAEIGGARGERLVEDTELGYLQMLTYRVWGPIAVGAFTQFDVGLRRQGRFEGIDAQGRAVVEDQVGGSYQELWWGPLLRAEHRRVFAELGYGLYGVRYDEGRGDLATATGDARGGLRTSPTVAWLLAIGGRVELAPAVDLSLRLEYRVRYYVRRGGSPLADDIVHGTQNFAPFVGVAWSFGPR